MTEVGDDRKPTKFGWFLMTAMKEAGLSQTQLARLTGGQVAQATLSRWIFFDGKPEPDKLKIIAPFIGVSYDELLSRVGHRDTQDMPAEVPQRRLTANAIEVNLLEGEDSPLSEEDRKRFSGIVGGVIAQFRPAKRGRRPA